jgi:hypothetical protein
MAYVEVKLKRAVEVFGHLYKPSASKIVVDDATLAAMGDAVASTAPAAAPTIETTVVKPAVAAPAAPAAPAARTAGHKPVVEAKSTAKKK